MQNVKRLVAAVTVGARLKIAFVALTLFLALAAAPARTVYVSPSDPRETINRRIAALTAGDTLIFRKGKYWLENKLVIQGLKGTADKPIVIRAEAPGQAVLEAVNQFDFNMIEMVGSEHVILDGLEIKGADEAIRFQQGNVHITLENLDLHMLGNVAIGAQGRDVELGYLVVRNCQIYNVGLGGGTGEGLYLGFHGSLQGFVHHALIERNYIHHTNAGSQGDGIELKHGSYANIIQDNVLHDVGPGITVNVTGRNNPAEVNIVRRNVIWNTDDFGIWTTGESLIENNVIFSVREASGIWVKQNPELPAFGVNDLTIRNNTVYDICCGPSVAALRMNAVHKNVIVANNAFYEANGDGYAIRLDFPITQITHWKKNFFYGELIGLRAGPETIRGNAPGREFTNSATVAGLVDLYPLTTSRLLSAADTAFLPSDDFNGNPRPANGGGEVGAYEVHGPSNTGWKIVPSFKQVGATKP